MLAATGNLVSAAFFVLLGIFFDFFDGLAARLLNVQSELGVQLDSLADVVTSGVVPGVVMFQLLLKTTNDWTTYEINTVENLQFLPFVGLILALGACYRLANFNIDTRQTDSFIGLPTPAMALFVISIPLIQVYSNNQFAIELIDNKWFLIIASIVLTILMNSELRLFSLKLKDFSFKKNWIQVLFLIFSLALLAIFQIVAIPLIIVLYILFSLLGK